MRILLKGILLIAVLVVIAGACNAIYASHLEKKFSPPGKIVSVSGYQMHIDCSGSGSPTVVLEGGRGSDWIYWQLVQPELSATTRVCSYDRAGLGSSEPQPG